MSTVPPGAFAVRKYRQNKEKLTNKMDSGTAELSPTKYSSKYMNSIWGMYNRYSVHNLKKNMDEMSHQQQSSNNKDVVGHHQAQSVEKNSTDFHGSLGEMTGKSFLMFRGYL